MHIIELNDRNVRLRNQDEVLVQSPGFANIADKQPIFGEEARRVARLHPRQTFTQFWSQLSLDPLANSNNLFRHQADLAFAHLNDIAGQHDLKDEVIFAVPSNYNRNQLAILLGLVKSCEFDAAGLVDMPLLAAGNAELPHQTVYLDIQLHQSVLTSFSMADNRVARNKVVQIPGTGLLALHDAWANMVTDEFIKQSRFDPQHNAETEQYVYNQLESWVGRALKDNEILMEINNKGTVFQARINQGHFEQRARNIFGRIRTELENLVDDASEVHVHEDHARLPGLDLYLKNITAVGDSLMMERCLAHMEQIKGEPGSLNFITSLPAGEKVQAAPRQAAHEGPTHVLVNHKAYSLPATVRYGSAAGTSGGGIITLSSDRHEGELVLSVAGSQARVDIHGEGAVTINGSPATSGSVLNTGDALAIAGLPTTLQLIQVE